MVVGEGKRSDPAWVWMPDAAAAAANRRQADSRDSGTLPQLIRIKPASALSLPARDRGRRRRRLITAGVAGDRSFFNFNQFSDPGHMAVATGCPSEFAIKGCVWSRGERHLQA
ncbi:hypothetical protein [Falsiroseomonas stagni]|uniref:hypothetical protein n=1 Tax=Falsiroseomonas stagni TaxID=484882 RepID=UPI001587B095|nr:hypothetical protein [Falsiroseomonas stagni]